MTERGQLGTRAQLPPTPIGAGVQWSEAGMPLIRIMKRTPAGKGLTVEWFGMDPHTGELHPLTKEQEPKRGEEAKQPIRTTTLRLKAVNLPVKEAETTQTAGLLWLESVTESEKPRILLSSDSSGGEFMARGESVLFHSQGAVYSVPLMNIDKATYLAMKQKADRARVMSHAKQAGLALIMWAQDHDEKFPTDGDVVGELMPYIKDASIFDGFDYTYDGGALADIASPAETEIGYVAGPGGKAVIYADGHVKWR
jgi:hypothetical protein